MVGTKVVYGGMVVVVVTRKYDHATDMIQVVGCLCAKLLLVKLIFDSNLVF